MPRLVGLRRIAVLHELVIPIVVPLLVLLLVVLIAFAPSGLFATSVGGHLFWVWVVYLQC